MSTVNTPNIGKEYAYYHICNSGISIGIDKQEIRNDDDSLGSDPFYVSPVLVISSNAYGVEMGTTQIPIKPGDLKLLGEWLIRESEHVKDQYKEGCNEFSFRLIDNKTGVETYWSDENNKSFQYDRKESEMVSDSCGIKAKDDSDISEYQKSCLRVESLNMGLRYATNIDQLLEYSKRIQEYLY